jgi:hypothetical protein
MAIPFVHCGANALIARQAMHLSMYHANRSVFFAMSAMNIDHDDTHPTSTVVNFSRSDPGATISGGYI